MKKINTFLKILLFTGVFLVSMSFVSTPTVVHAADRPQCTSPTAFVDIGAAASGDDQDVSFNVTKLEVPKNTCVGIRMRNSAPTQVHDIVVEPNDGDGFTGVDMDVDNSTATYPVGLGPGVNQFNVTTPDKDVTYEFFCEQPGHKDAGMVGDFIVGKGSPAAPGFELPVVLVSLVFVTIVATTWKRKRN